MSDGGKGSSPRPLSVSRDTFADNWANTFKKAPEIDTFSEDDDEDEICSGCSGSGEGVYDGSTCYKCKGRGVEPIEKDDEP